jgi:hypothetical protein
MCIEVAVPFVKPWPIGIEGFVTKVIGFTVGVINIQAVFFAMRSTLADTSGNGRGMLVKVFMPLHKLYNVSVV